jgi:hypothetical protein
VYPVLAEDEFALDEDEFDVDESYDDFDDFDVYDDEDEFLGDLWRRAQALRQKIKKSPAASAIAKGIATGAGGLSGVYLGGRWSDDKKSGRPWGGVVGSALGGTLGNWLFADEEEDLEYAEDAEEIIAQMEELGYLASRAPTQEDADEFIGALIPLATRLIPKAASLVSKVAPTVMRGAKRVARVLRRSPTTRKLVRTIPSMVRGATRQIARQAVRGRPPTRTVARKAVRQQAMKVVSSPRRAATALGRNSVLTRRLAAQNRALQMKIIRARRALA